ncbi:MAG: 3'-5' exonuclease [Pseudomonadota bacterium]|jgi:DNA polymerase-3 subunit epsilon
MTSSPLEPFELESVIAWLENQNHKVIRPFIPPLFYNSAPSSTPLLKAALLDVETTGTDFQKDKIIEIGIIIAEYCPQTGQGYRVLESYDELEDPGIPIPPASTKIHGITDEMVQGRNFNSEKIQELVQDVSLIIAHNATFDRRFMEARFPFFQEKAWACSFSQIPWREEGFGSAALEHLLYRAGFHFNGHRAVIDCHALLTVLQLDLPESGIKAFKKLVDAAQTPDLKIWALNTPFESKDKLKNRQYRWHAEQRTWYKPISDADLEQEVSWLRLEVYDHRPFQLKQETIDAYNRFSIREGFCELVRY